MAVDIDPTRRNTVRRWAFRLVLVALAVLCTFMSPLPFLVLGWFMEVAPGEVSHAVHEISFGALFALALVAVLGQLRRPEAKVALAYQAVIPIAVLIGFALVVDRMFDPIIAVFSGAIVLLVVLHPVGRRLALPRLEPHPGLLAAAAVIVVPFALFTVAEVELAREAARLIQRIAADFPPEVSEAAFEAAIANAGLTATQEAAVEHSFHWSAMAAYAVTCVLLAVVAALRPPGWRVVAWSAGSAVAVYGAASLVFPLDASAAPWPWALLALLWAGAFLALAHRARSPRPEELATPLPEPA